jgi:hypothetical protein
MLKRGRIALSAEETAALEQLLADNPDEQASFTRTEPGETGPIRVEFVGAEIADFLIHEDGSTEEVT